MSIADDIRTLHKNYCDKKVLYVEDDTNVRMQTITFLKKFFYTVDYAVNGLDGLKKYQDKHYDIVISDLKMPKMDGREMLHQIRAQDKNIILIVMTASDSNIDASSVTSDYYLNKPVALQDFVTVFKSLEEKIFSIK